MARSVSALPMLIPVRSQDDTARGMVVALIMDDGEAGLSLVIHDFQSNRLRAVDAALWRVDRSSLPHGIALPAPGALRT